MTRFTIHHNDEVWDMGAESCYDAARIFTIQIYGSECFPERISGDPKKSGFFQAYKNLGDGVASTSVGTQFHVMRTEILNPCKNHNQI